MGWLDELGKLAREVGPAAKPVIASKPKMKPQQVIATLRGANGTDPGEVAIGYYVVTDGMLKMTNERGTKSGKSARLREGDNAAAIASVLLLRSQQRSDFNRQIVYPSSGVV